jgi:exopolysaccharide biosynthesis polyprenyl glycosylphosphotransferase
LADSGPLIRPLELAHAGSRNGRLGPLVAIRVMGDALAVAAGALIGYWYRFHISGVPIPGGAIPSFADYAMAVPVVVALWLLVFSFTGRYRVQRGQSFVDEILGSAGSVALFVILALALEGLYRGFPYSRLVLADASLAALALFILERAAIRGIQGALFSSGFGAVRVLVVGSGEVADLLIRRLRMFPEYGYQLVGRVATTPGATPDTSDLATFSIEHGLARIIAREHADMVVLALGEAGHDQVVELANACLTQGAEVKVVPDILEIMTSAARTEQVAGMPLIGLRPNRLVGRNLILKRGFDLLFTAILAIPVAPVVGVCALAISLTSKGSPFYAQERLGLQGRRFRVWKLRSMVVDAERHTGPVMATEGDRRTTPVGRFVRRFSLDELPQLWNVIKGEMSLVGPRPERPYFAARFERAYPRYRERLQAPPGCTGWAQVNDLRQGNSMEERIFYDLYYIENWSLGFDLKILLLTPWRILFHQHAY